MQPQAMKPAIAAIRVQSAISTATSSSSMAAPALLIAHPTDRHHVRMSQRQIVQALCNARSLR
jgi:hypothetical protein